MALYTQEQHDKTKQKIGSLVDYWLSVTGLKHWEKIDIIYSEEAKETNVDCCADCSVSWEYKQAAITFYVPLLMDQPDERLEYFVVHEISHILVAEMREFGPDQNKEENWTGDAWAKAMKHEERTVTSLAQALIWTNKAGAGVLSHKGNTLRHPFRGSHKGVKK